MDTTASYGTLATDPTTQPLEPAAAPQETTAASKGWLIAGIAFWLLGGFYGAYLSWSCNSNHGFEAVSKVIFSFFSLLGGWGYVINYLIFKSWTCDPVASLVSNPGAAARFLEGHRASG
jgi:hypothetical protein